MTMVLSYMLNFNKLALLLTANSYPILWWNLTLELKKITPKILHCWHFMAIFTGAPFTNMA